MRPFCGEAGENLLEDKEDGSSVPKVTTEHRVLSPPAHWTLGLGVPHNTSNSQVSLHTHIQCKSHKHGGSGWTGQRGCLL